MTPSAKKNQKSRNQFIAWGCATNSQERKKKSRSQPSGHPRGGRLNSQKVHFTKVTGPDLLTFTAPFSFRRLEGMTPGGTKKRGGGRPTPTTSGTGQLKWCCGLGWCGLAWSTGASAQTLEHHKKQNMNTQTKQQATLQKRCGVSDPSSQAKQEIKKPIQCLGLCHHQPRKKKNIKKPTKWAPQRGVAEGCLSQWFPI